MGTSSVSQGEGLVMNHETGFLEPMFVGLARPWLGGTIRESAGIPGIGDSKIKTGSFLKEFDQAIRAAYIDGLSKAHIFLRESATGKELSDKIKAEIEESKNV